MCRILEEMGVKFVRQMPVRTGRKTFYADIYTELAPRDRSGRKLSLHRGAKAKGQEPQRVPAEKGLAHLSNLQQESNLPKSGLRAPQTLYFAPKSVISRKNFCRERPRPYNLATNNHAIKLLLSAKNQEAKETPPEVL